MKLMASPVAIVIILGILTGSISVSQSSYINYYHCGTNGNYTSDSIYNKNLDSALANLSSAANTSDSGSYNASMGEDSDKVNALVLCRGDVLPHICRSCVKDSSKRLREQCPDQKEAVNWEDECMLRYSNNWTLKNLVMEPTKAAINTTDATDEYYSELSFLLNDLWKEAVQQWFATKNRSRPDFLTIYGLLQCTPDLSQEQCDHCFDSVIGAINSSCSKDIGCQIMNPSCRLRFEANRFYNKTVYNYVPPAPPPSSVPPPGKDDSTMRTVIIIVVVIVGFVILLLILICIFKRKSRQMSATETWQNDVEEDINSAELLQYHFAAVEFATNYFSGNRKLGQGGFGAVYKGTLKSGQEVAVKRLSKGSNQGEQEFKNEVLLVAKLQHRNLVRLHGFCYEGTERILIYEFVLNGSLDHFLFDSTKRSLLDWKRRYKIIGGVARGLLYLHEDSRLRIIHRDLKASNVLLDAYMNPKIADFGMARLFDMDETQGNTSRPAGTYGYMAPEYAMYGQFSVKSDVFSFGVLVLEILSGQKNNSIRSGEIDEDLASAAWKNWKEGNASNVIDPTLRNSSESIREMIRCIHIGLLCVQENVAERPTMASVVFMLNSSSRTLALPSEPAFFMHNSTDPEVSSSEDTLNSTVSTYKSIKAKEKYFDHSLENSCSTDLYPL